MNSNKISTNDGFLVRLKNLILFFDIILTLSWWFIFYLLLFSYTKFLGPSAFSGIEGLMTVYPIYFLSAILFIYFILRIGRFYYEQFQITEGKIVKHGLLIGILSSVFVVPFLEWPDGWRSLYSLAYKNYFYVYVLRNISFKILLIILIAFLIYIGSLWGKKTKINTPLKHTNSKM